LERLYLDKWTVYKNSRDKSGSGFRRRRFHRISLAKV